MVKNSFFGLVGLLIGIAVAYVINLNPSVLSLTNGSVNLFTADSSSSSQQKVIGFLPYWLLDKAQTDYKGSINTLSYFALTVDSDGSILKLTTPVESDPGWHSLNSGKLDTFFNDARKNKIALSLVVFNGDKDVIDQLIADPKTNAHNLLSDVLPLMKKYGFTDLNLDIESTKDATADARENFTIFTKEIKDGLGKATLTVDVTGNDLIKPGLINPKDIGQIADYLLIMAYDYHYAGSFVSGPVAPLRGAGISSEYDVATAVEKTQQLIPSQKIILGVPLYGYEWETLGTTPRSGVIPGSGLTASTERIEKLLSSCSTCSVKTDKEAGEQYLTYKDEDTQTYHQIFYPDPASTQTKVDYTKSENLGGVALWALGYEGSDLLLPLKDLF